MTTALAPAPRLAELADRINAEHRDFEAALRDSLQHARAAGELLLEAKGLCQHGGWLPWLREHFHGSERSAQNYIKVARRWPELEKSATVSDLTYREAITLLAEHKADEDPGDNARRKSITEIPREHRGELCGHWWDIQAHWVVLLATAGWEPEKIADFLAIDPDAVLRIINPNPRFRSEAEFLLWSNPETRHLVYSAYCESVEHLISAWLERAYLVAAWSCEQDGFGEHKPALEGLQAHYARRCKMLSPIVPSNDERMGAIINSCVIADARFAAGVDMAPPPRFFELFTMYGEIVDKQFADAELIET